VGPPIYPDIGKKSSKQNKKMLNDSQLLFETKPSTEALLDNIPYHPRDLFSSKDSLNPSASPPYLNKTRLSSCSEGKEENAGPYHLFLSVFLLIVAHKKTINRKTLLNM